LLPGQHQTVVDIELSEELAALPLRDIHTSYRIDPTSSALVPKDG
jgi:hypothetical protein